MKFLILIILLSFELFAQKEITKLSDEQPGGYLLPAEGEIHALLIFAQFPDDNYQPESNEWKKNDLLPRKLKEKVWIDEKWTGQPTPETMTDFFNDMSFGKLHLTGKSIGIIAPHTRDWYIKNKKRISDIHTDIINEIDKQIDFAEYDKWTRTNFYNHKEVPDGNVDMVFFVWRNIHLDLPPDTASKVLGTLGFGWFGSTSVIEVKVDEGKRNINSLSGVTIQDFFTKDPFRFCIHEFSHYLLGGNEFHNGYGFWAMLNGYRARSFMINSFERQRLGWSQLKTIGPGAKPSDYELRDFITTGDAIRIEINKTNYNYFYIENHQRISKWDEPSQDPDEKGIYVLRRNSFAGDNKFMQIIPADGKYTWEVTGFQYPDYYKQGVPVFRRVNPDRKKGYLDTEFIPFKYDGKDYPPWEVIFYNDSASGKPVENPLNSGDGRDAFRPGFKNVFSPWSNPPSELVNKPAAAGFYLKNINNQTAYLTIYNDSSLIGPPSKPDRPVLAPSGNNVTITWQKNIEPDAKGYRIYKVSGDKEEKIGEADVNILSFSYTNENFRERNIHFKVSCFDKNGEESLKSETGEWIK